MSSSNIDWAKAEIAKKKAEIADLEAYIRVEALKPGAGRPVATSPSLFTEPPAAVTSPKQTPVSVAWMIMDKARGAKKRAILKALASTPAAQTGWIVAAIHTLGISGATPENTSPQLSAYKADGLVDLIADGWAITQKGREYLAEKN